MYQCVAIAKINEGAVDTVLEAAKILVEETRKEPGLIYYNVLRSEKDPNVLVMIEKWETKENFLAHVQGAPCANFGKVIDPNCTEPSIIHECEVVL